jgi:hypothetical protein
MTDNPSPTARSPLVLPPICIDRTVAFGTVMVIVMAMARMREWGTVSALSARMAYQDRSGPKRIREARP